MEADKRKKSIPSVLMSRLSLGWELSSLGTLRMAEHSTEFSHQGAPSILIHQWLRAAFRSISSSALALSVTPHANQTSSCEIPQMKQIPEIPQGEKGSNRHLPRKLSVCIGNGAWQDEFPAPNRFCHTKQIPVLLGIVSPQKTLLPPGMRHL